MGTLCCGTKAPEQFVGEWTNKPFEHLLIHQSGWIYYDKLVCEICFNSSEWWGVVRSYITERIGFSHFQVKQCRLLSIVIEQNRPYCHVNGARERSWAMKDMHTSDHPAIDALGWRFVCILLHNDPIGSISLVHALQYRALSLESFSRVKADLFEEYMHIQRASIHHLGRTTDRRDESVKSPSCCEWSSWETNNREKTIMLASLRWISEWKKKPDLSLLWK